MRHILLYLVSLLVLFSCNNNAKKAANEEAPLYEKPVIVSLDTINGYKFNLLTGDSVKPLLSSFGSTVKTGVPVFFSGTDIKEIKISSSKPVSVNKRSQLIIPRNVHPLQGKPDVIFIDTAHLQKVKLGEGDQSFVLRNSYGIIKSGVSIPVSGKPVLCKESKPVKALPLRIKDGATSGIQYLDVDQGLSFPYIYTVMEDKKGNLWFGTDGSGISKYNGTSFVNYSVKEGLSNGTVISMIEDRNGNIWMGTLNGVTKFDGIFFTQFTEKEGLSNSKISSIMEDRKGNLWFGTEGAGVTKYDGKTFINYTTKEGLPGNFVQTCIEDRKGNIWFGTDKGAACFDGTTFTYYTSKNGLLHDDVLVILEDKKGNIWFGSGMGGVCQFDGEEMIRYSEKDGLSGSNVLSMAEDHIGNIWIGTLNGLNKFDGKSFTNFRQEQGLTKNKVLKIIEDRFDNIWIGTEGGGVNKLSNTNFSYLIPEELFKNFKVRPILNGKDGSLWFGAEFGGLEKYDAVHTTASGNRFIFYTSKDGLAEIGQRSLLQDRSGNIWIGTTGAGIYKFDGKQFSNYAFNGTGSKLSIFDIAEDKRGDLWFGTSDGTIIRYDSKKTTFYDQRNGLPYSIIYSIMEDSNGNLWFCSEGGLSKYDGIHIINYSEKEGLFNKNITSIDEDENGNLWLGTLGAGVCKFNGKTFTYYTEKQGLSNDNVWSVFEDTLKRIWVGTDKGLNLFIAKDSARKDYFIYRFGFQDGLKAVDFNLHSVCVDNNNRIWWGTGKGVASFNLNKGFKAFNPQSLSINYIEINGQFFDFKNFSSDSSFGTITFDSVAAFDNYPDKLSLSHSEDHLTFHFSAIDWSATDKIRYSYRMVGLNEKWSVPSEETIADYRNLGYGKYKFQVRAIGRSQNWTEPFTYSFTIRPAWWQTWWFKTIIIISSLLTLLYISRLIYLYRLRKQRILLEKQLAIQYERQRISSEMHDDVGAGLSGIKLLAELAKTKITDEEAAAEIEKIHDSIGNVSANMKEVIWSLDSDNDNLENLVAFIQKQARRLLEHYPCQLNIMVPDTIPAKIINGSDRRNIYLLVKEAMHNIIKHSLADKVDLSLTCDKDLMIIISDNGQGMNIEKKSNTGNGMKNMRQRIRQLNGNFFIKNDKGLTLIFEIPLPETI